MAFSNQTPNDNEHNKSLNSQGAKNKNEETWSRYMVVEAEDPAVPLTKLSPFAIAKGFQGISTSIKIKRMKPGVFLLDCPDPKISKTVQGWNGKIFVDRKIKVSPHRSLNTSRGVIHCRDLDETPVEEIQEELKVQGVTQVHRVTRKKGEGREDTHTYFLTFSKPSPPTSVKIGYLSTKVTPFIQQPLRCFNCQRFGHSKNNCKGQPVCEKCGHSAHTDTCSQTPTCTNCKGAHGPSSKKCPTYQKEILIQKIKIEKKISFAEARREVEGSQGGKTYADAAAPATGLLKAKTPAPKKALITRRLQFGAALPEDVHAESLALAKELLKDLKKKKTNTKDYSAQFTFGTEAPPEQAKEPAPPSSSRAKPGEPPRSAPQASEGERTSPPGKKRKSSNQALTPGFVLGSPNISFGKTNIDSFSSSPSEISFSERKRWRTRHRRQHQTEPGPHLFNPFGPLSQENFSSGEMDT